MKKRILLKHLIENGIDFLNRSISDFDSSPKFSVIHFYSGLELLIKARLMAEHWTLIVSKRQEPHLANFLSGDFQSVTLEEAAQRLRDALQDGLNPKELEVFHAVRNHRNKMVHFFHDTEQDPNIRAMVTKEQLTAWYLLHRRLTNQWERIFRPWQKYFSKFDTDLRKRHKYLETIFEASKGELEELKKKGFLIENCPACGLASQIHDDTDRELYESMCQVCGLKENCLNFECDQCHSSVRFINEGFATCSCGIEYTPEILAEALLEEPDPKEPSELGNCGECDGFHTVVELGADYLCTNCFETTDMMFRCDWCNEPNTKNMDDSYFAGCNHCEGSAGWQAQKDD